MSGSLLAGIVITDGTSGGGGGGSNTIQELYADPVSPSPEEVWVLATAAGAITDGHPIGLLLALTYTGNTGSISYRLSYRTLEGTTVRVSLS
jgi:hypothetical protein